MRVLQLVSGLLLAIYIAGFVIVYSAAPFYVKRLPKGDHCFILYNPDYYIIGLVFYLFSLLGVVLIYGVKFLNNRTSYKEKYIITVLFLFYILVFSIIVIGCCLFPIFVTFLVVPTWSNGGLR